MSSILAIDYGEKRVGLALAEEGSQLVLPFGVLERESDEQLSGKVHEIIAAENVCRIIVGDPVSLSGSPSEQTSRARLFAKKLELGGSVPVELVNEQYTSSRADEALRAGSTKARDELAAMFLLQDYLERVGGSR